MTKYVVLQEFKHDNRASTWDDLGEFEGNTPALAARAAVEAMSAADQTKAKTTKFRAAAASSFNDLPTPSVDTKTTVSFA